MLSIGRRGCRRRGLCKTEATEKEKYWDRAKYGASLHREEFLAKYPQIIPPDTRIAGRNLPLPPGLSCSKGP